MAKLPDLLGASSYLSALESAGPPINLLPPGPRNPAERAVERLGKQIAEFESSLTPEEEVGAILIGAPGRPRVPYDAGLRDQYGPAGV